MDLALKYQNSANMKFLEIFLDIPLGLFGDAMAFQSADKSILPRFGKFVCSGLMPELVRLHSNGSKIISQEFKCARC